MKEIDAVIVGGGASGSFVAHVLHERGMTVLVLEAGERHPSPHGAEEWESVREKHFDVDPDVWRYEGDFDWARVRALGGRTLVWGGWCSRPTERTFEDAALSGVPFPFALGEIEPFFPLVERMLGVMQEPVSPVFAPIRESLGLTVEGKRTARRSGRPTSGVDLLEGIHVEPDAVVTKVLEGGVELHGGRVVRARHVILAASAIETARLLMESGIGDVGSGLVDHMVASYLLLDRGSDALAASAVVPRFVHGDYIGGFATEITGPQPGSTLSAEQRRILEIDERAARRMSFFTIHSMGPTMPSPKARVSLGEARDSLGRRVPRIETNIGENERAMVRDMTETCVAIADALGQPGATVVPFADPLTSRAGHEAGTCRTAVDGQGRLRDFENVWVVDSSILPVALDVHPTLTLLAIAARTASNIR